MTQRPVQMALIALAVLTACAGGESSTPVSGSPTAEGNTTISAIQGPGDVSPLVGQTVTVFAVVSGDFQDSDADSSNDLGGFYIQQETPDANAASSEGIFVFEGDNAFRDVAVGDRVEVSGTVTEFFGETQIEAASVRVTGSGTISPTVVNLPTSGTVLNSDGNAIADLERFEGMLLHFPQKLSVSGLRFLEQYGEVRLTEGGRAFQFTNSNRPDPAAYAAHTKALAARSIILDDGQRSRYPASIRYLNAGAAADYSIRAGDSITGVTGNLRYSRGSGGGGDESWRIEPVANPAFDDDNPRPGAPAITGRVRVSSFNVLNFFSSVDDGRAVCGPQRDQNCRGADSELELSRQLEKTVSALQLIDADIIGLVELENNASASVSTIAKALNERMGGGTYAWVDTGTIHDDAIKTAFLYDSATIRTSGQFALLTSTVDTRFNDRRNRPALAQTFEVVENGAKLTVVVNHLKSKGSSCEADGDPNTADGQGNCNTTRSNAAAAMVDWIETDPTNSADPDVLIIGDLNAYLQEDPLTVFNDAGLTNLPAADADAYTFIFDAQAGALDHALASASLPDQVTEVIEWHINADEPPLLDYNLENSRDANLFDPTSPYRASDHDPIIIGFDLTE